MGKASPVVILSARHLIASVSVAPVLYLSPLPTTENVSLYMTQSIKIYANLCHLLQMGQSTEFIYSALDPK